MKVFNIVLPNEKAKTYRYVTLLVILINSLVFGFIFLHAPLERTRNISFFGCSLGILMLLFFLLKNYKKIFSYFRPEISGIILIICWLIIGEYLFAIAMLFFLVLGFYVNRKFVVVFSAAQIVYPSFPKKNYLWKDVTNVILKDDILTIDLKNNKLIQSVIDKESESVNVIKFNAFCKEMLGLH